MRKDVKRILICSAISFIITIICAAFFISEQIEKQNRNFTISHADTTLSGAGFLTLLFGFVTILGFIIAFVFYSEDKQYDESLKDNS
jgi:hypothetical protein